MYVKHDNQMKQMNDKITTACMQCIIRQDARGNLLAYLVFWRGPCLFCKVERHSLWWVVTTTHYYKFCMTVVEMYVSYCKSSCFLISKCVGGMAQRYLPRCSSVKQYNSTRNTKETVHGLKECSVATVMTGSSPGILAITLVSKLVHGAMETVGILGIASVCHRSCTYTHCVLRDSKQAF